MFAIYKKELRAYFLSPVGYIFMGFFLLVSGYFFATMNLLQASPHFLGVLSSITFIFLFVVPILTMRLISEEAKTKTDQLLLTSPLSLASIVVGKYLAAISVFIITLLVTSIYPFIMSVYGTIPSEEIMGGYVGFFLMGSSFIAVGLFISALTENQIIAAVITFSTLLMLWLMDMITGFINNRAVVTVINWVSLLRRHSEFTMGILNLEHIVYYISFSAIFVFLTIRVIERKRWA